MPARHCCTRGCVGIDRVGLPLEPAGLAVSAIDLDHAETMSGELSAQLCPVGASSFHPDPDNRTPAGDPGLELLIAGFGGWEALVGDLPADPVDDAHHVNIGVGVDSHPHLLVLVLVLVLTAVERHG